MKCLRCNNSDLAYFYDDKGIYYCRKCIQFGRLDVGSHPRVLVRKIKKHHSDYHLHFTLTKKQQTATQQIVKYIQDGHDVLVYAACGAGKTELSMEPIKLALNAGLKVGFAIARTQVVLEVAKRMAEAFKSIKVIAVCEGHTTVTDADLIVCTMHQLYRYPQTFDLLIMDEVDAFPYKHNEMLEAIAHHSVHGRILYLSATPDAGMLEKVKLGKLKMVELFERPHGHPLIYPTFVRLPQSLQLIHFFFFMKKEEHQVLAFVPTIYLANHYALLFSAFFRCKALTSKSVNKEKIVNELKEHRLNLLFATTVLERGITIAGVDIVIFQSDHELFDEASLIQIVGRVGRSKDQPNGVAILYSMKKSRAMKRCYNAIKKMNE